MVGRYASYILIGIGAVFSFGVPSFYRENAPWISGAWLVALLGIIWNMLRGYRSRVLRPTRPRLMLAYLVGFLFLDHVLNFVCFVNIEVPLEFPMASAGLGMFPFYAVVVITASHLLFSLANWVVLGGTLRVMGSRCAWSLAARITLYSLPVTLLTALPGAEIEDPILDRIHGDWLGKIVHHDDPGRGGGSR